MAGVAGVAGVAGWSRRIRFWSAREWAPPPGTRHRGQSSVGRAGSRTLNLRSIRVIGYDMDYTLIHYKARPRARATLSLCVREAAWTLCVREKAWRERESMDYTLIHYKARARAESARRARARNTPHTLQGARARTRARTHVCMCLCVCKRE